MAIPNSERILVSLLREIAAEQGIELASFSQDWILRLEKGGRTRHVVGYNFEINSAAAHMLAGDKAALADVFAHCSIPHVEHRLFHHPNLEGYVPKAGNWAAILEYAAENKFPLVVKPNNGTGGVGVTRVEDVSQLEKSVISHFQKNRSICLSPFLDIDQEYRLIVLDERCELAYCKRRPHATGDGRHSLRELVEKQLLAGAITQTQAAEALEQPASALERVPPTGQEVVLGWKHNLAAGSAPTLLASDQLPAPLVELARAAQKAINIRFASVDIVDVQGQLQVLEINSGVMMEHFVRSLPEQRAAAKAIYARAVEKMLAGPH